MDHDQYENFSEAYSDSKQSDAVRLIEAPSLLNIIGKVEGLTVLDLACGDGFYSRKLKEKGAAAVTGVDISAAMIKLARHRESLVPQKIQYRCDDVLTMPVLGAFDLVVAAFLLHYSKDVNELDLMCQNICINMASNGRLVTICDNPFQAGGKYTLYKKYGFIKTIQAPLKNGSGVSYLMATGKRPFKLRLQHFNASTYETALSNAGLTDIKWHELRLSSHGIDAQEAYFWQDYLSNPPVIGLSARMPN